MMIFIINCTTLFHDHDHQLPSLLPWSWSTAQPSSMIMLINCTNLFNDHNHHQMSISIPLSSSAIVHPPSTVHHQQSLLPWSIINSQPLFCGSPSTVHPTFMTHHQPTVHHSSIIITIKLYPSSIMIIDQLSILFNYNSLSISSPSTPHFLIFLLS